MDDILVSIVMPAYNCENYICQAIQSVLTQRVALELIVVEDCSRDGTFTKIQSFSSDERVVCVRNERNLGVAASRNRGIAMAKGKYIAFLDGDDYWTEDKLEKQVDLMEDKQAVISSTGRELINESGELTGKVIGIPEVVTYHQLLKGNVLNTSGVMLLASVAKRYPMVQDNLHEDYIMWLSILKECGKAYGIDEPLLKYRVMTGTKSSNKIKSARMTFGVYRYLGYGVFQSVYYFLWYAVKGFFKYM